MGLTRKRAFAMLMFPIMAGMWKETMEKNLLLQLPEMVEFGVLFLIWLNMNMPFNTIFLPSLLLSNYQGKCIILKIGQINRILPPLA